MALTITLPEELPLIGASYLSTVFLLYYQTVVVSKARRAAKISYPQLYAEKAQEETSPEAKRFNCAQRAHQNTLENLPIVYVTAAIAASQYPLVASSLLGAWTGSRVLYTRGYATGDPAKRSIGGRPGALFQVGLLGTALTVIGGALRSYFKL